MSDDGGAGVGSGGGLVPGSGEGGYGCYTDNCDGKGGACIVDCFIGGNCTGTTPGPVNPARGRRVDINPWWE